MKFKHVPPQTNALCKIAGRLPIKRLRMPCAEKRRFDELFDSEFPFAIKSYLFANGYSWSPQNGQDGLALIVPLDGLLRVDTGERLIELGSGEILIAQDLNIGARAETEASRVHVLVISFLPCFVYSLGSPSNDYFFLLPFYGNYGSQAPVVREASSLREIHRLIARLVQCYLDRTSYSRLDARRSFWNCYIISRDSFVILTRSGLKWFSRRTARKDSHPYWSMWNATTQIPSR
jgi:hypothetical protein